MASLAVADPAASILEVRNRRPTARAVLLCLMLAAMGIGCDGKPTQAAGEPEQKPERDADGADVCPLGPPVEIDGKRRLALVVGVGEYRSRKVKDLAGPPRDAERVYRLLTDETGFGYPAENVCLLLDEDATTGQFNEAFERVLVERARAGDIAVIYFAGHGSQTRDADGDEPDGWDETLLFHDARTDSVRDLTDDALNEQLTRLHARTDNITVILDSCNSGTATRAGDDGYVARFQPAQDNGVGNGARSDLGGDGDASWTGRSLPGLVTLSAAADGSVALETEGRGVFTDALLDVLGGVTAQRVSYAQAARQIRQRVAARSYQIPYFQGDLGRLAFGVGAPRLPVGWEVIESEPSLRIGGAPLPGIGPGAELRIYDGTLSGAALRDPAPAKATIAVVQSNGIEAVARVLAGTGRSIVPGDRAQLVRPADDVLRIRLRLRPATEPGGLDAALAAALQGAVGDHPEARLLVQEVQGAGDFELSLDPSGKVLLRGPENQVRNVFERQPSMIAEALWRHARQKGLLHLRGEGGGDFIDNETLRVEIVPAARQDPCAVATWRQSPPNEEQVIPLCHNWNVRVELSSQAPRALLVGGVVLSNDGSMLGFPSDGRVVRLRPGETTTFTGRGETFKGTPPLDVQDRILVFGTHEDDPVAWHQLTATAAERRAYRGSVGALHRALDRYLSPGARGAAVATDAREARTWTLTMITMRVQAEPRSTAP